MAWAHSALSSSYSILPFINPIRKALILASFSRPSSRKNSLRPKLLKTLTKPPIHQSLEIPNPTFEGLHPESEHEQIEQLGQMEQKELMLQAEMVNLPPFPETQGEIQETSHELVNPRESSELKTNPSCANDDESNPADMRSKDGKREIENDVWWTRLPYACAIFMSRDSENEGPSGLFSLTLDDGPLSHTVAFEDRYDATNFCYILESFFEELGDVTVDIVLLSNEELVDAAKCTSRKLIVVRKGQLKLYAGKPLEEVELALRSLIK